MDVAACKKLIKKLNDTANAFKIDSLHAETLELYEISIRYHEKAKTLRRLAKEIQCDLDKQNKD